MAIVTNKRSKLQADSYKSSAYKVIQELCQWGAKYGLKPARLNRMGIVRVSKDDATAVLGYTAPAAGYLIPYFDIDGNKAISFAYASTITKTLGRK